MIRQLLREIGVVIVIMSDPDPLDRLEPALRRQLVQLRSRPFVAGVDQEASARPRDQEPGAAPP